MFWLFYSPLKSTLFHYRSIMSFLQQKYQVPATGLYTQVLSVTRLLLHPNVHGEVSCLLKYTPCSGNLDLRKDTHQNPVDILLYVLQPLGFDWNIFSGLLGITNYCLSFRYHINYNTTTPLPISQYL